MPRHPVNGIIGIAGPIYDLDFFDPSDNTPLFLAHGVCDDKVPYKTGAYFNCPIETTVHGSYEIAFKANELGKPFTIYSIKGLGHEYPKDINDFLASAIRDWMKDPIICGEPVLAAEFTLQAEEANCAETIIGLANCQ